MVIRLRREGRLFRQIAADTNRYVSTVHRRWLAQVNVARSRGPGAARVTSAREDRLIHRQVVAVLQTTSTSILQPVQDTLDVPISTRTISRRLVESGLHSRRPLRKLALIPQRRRARLEWCRNRATWMTEWWNVMFSDESRFCFFNDSQRIRVWRRRGV
ncbi:transposable element Tcb1 transposase [Trichonephila clavipes]|nr:transposable element Tcb1 transposase [Trichonephila clavipes]